MMGSPKEVDVCIGAQIQRQRHRLGLSLHELAAKLGMSSDDLADCEVGHRRVSSDQLYGLATVLEMPLSRFFADPSSDTLAGRTSRLLRAG